MYSNGPRSSLVIRSTKNTASPRCDAEQLGVAAPGAGDAVDLLGEGRVDAVALAQQRVQRAVVEVGGGEAVDAVAAQVGGLHADRLAAAEAQPPEPHDRAALVDLQRLGDVAGGGDAADVEHAGGDVEAEDGHLLAEAGQGPGAGDEAGRADERAAAVLAAQDACRLEVGEGVAHGDPADPEEVGELVLAGDARPGCPRAAVDRRPDRLLDLVPQRLGAAPVGAGHRRHQPLTCHQSGPRRAATRAPISPADGPSAPPTTSMSRRCGGSWRVSAACSAGASASTASASPPLMITRPGSSRATAPASAVPSAVPTPIERRPAQPASPATAAATSPATVDRRVQRRPGGVEHRPGGVPFEPAVAVVAGVVDVGARPAERRRRPVAAAQDPPAAEHGRADAGADRQQQGVGPLERGTLGRLGEQGEVGVVADGARRER